MKAITIGRDNSCDIVINDSRVSRVHANIILQGNSYIYRDNSMNGTLINGVLLKHGEMRINFGDSVLLAGNIALPWNKVQNILPLANENSYVQNSYAQNPYAQNTYAYGGQFPGQQIPPKSALPENIRGWNWGAFYFSWLWAVCNGIYWPLVVLIPVVGWLSILVIMIILGINGNQWAWEKKQWRSIEHFKQVQHNWAIAALCVFILAVLSTLFIILILFSW